MHLDLLQILQINGLCQEHSLPLDYGRGSGELVGGNGGSGAGFFQNQFWRKSRRAHDRSHLKLSGIDFGPAVGQAHGGRENPTECPSHALGAGTGYAQHEESEMPGPRWSPGRILQKVVANGGPDPF